MEELFIVANSSGLLRDGTRFTVGALVGGCWDTCLQGVPQLLAHDHSRQTGWVFPRTIFIQPGLTRVTAIGYMATDSRELESMETARLAKRKEEIHNNEKAFDNLRSLISSQLRGNEQRIAFPTLVAFIGDGLATRVFEGIFELAKRDKDYLVPIDHLRVFRPGIFHSGDLLLFAHHYFRRGQHRLNQLNTHLLEQLQTLEPTLRPRIAIDPDMVGFVVEPDGIEIEHQYWWGPKFDNDLQNIPSGVTVHVADESDKVFFNIERTEFRWGISKEYGQVSGRIFEAEELRAEPSAIDKPDTYCCRYLHSITNDQNDIIHVDGAIRAYSDTKMMERLATDISKAGKHTDYTKLWRVDGNLSISTWKSLVSNYFRDNRLVGEYFGTEESEVSVIPSANKPTTLQQYVPYSMQKGASIRIAISFIENYSKEHLSSQWVLIPLDSALVDDNRINVVENTTLELQKAMLRLGAQLEISSNLLYVAFKDEYVNLPCIYHGGKQIKDDIEKTLGAIRMLVNTWVQQERDLFLTFNLRYPLEDRDIWISIAGHVEDLAHFLSSLQGDLPKTREECIAWAEKTARQIGKEEQLYIDQPKIQDILTPNGDIYMKRTPLTAEYQLHHDETGIRYSLKESSLDADSLAALKAGELSLAPSFIITSSTCTVCGGDYKYCPHSKLLDEAVAERIDRIDKMQLFWTDRPLWR